MIIHQAYLHKFHHRNRHVNTCYLLLYSSRDQLSSKLACVRWGTSVEIPLLQRKSALSIAPDLVPPVKLSDVSSRID